MRLLRKVGERKDGTKGIRKKGKEMDVMQGWGKE
jgi:hypothetical protein